MRDSAETHRLGPMGFANAQPILQVPQSLKPFALREMSACHPNRT